MARVQTIVQLNTDLLVALDDEAEASGTSRSAIIRQAIVSHLDANRATRIETALINGYTALPQDAHDEWGNVLDQSRQNTKRTLERLDAEEEAAGVTW